jgi:two-component system response regulator
VNKATVVEPIEVLMAEDNGDDIALMMATLEDMKIHINVSVVRDGVEALEYLHGQGKYSSAVTPDLILLDLNMPRKDGREVLEEIKQDDNLKRIPVVILTTSEAEEDVLRAYDLHANCYITKPVNLDQFTKVVRAIEQFWFTIVKLP